MASAMKVLGQVSPAATTLTTIYTVPASKQATCSTLTVCNSNVGDVTFRIAIAIANAADNIKQYLYYDLPLPTKDTFSATLGVTLATTDVVKVYTTATNVSFNLFGIEYDA